MTPSRRFFRLADVLQMWGEERARAHARANGLDEAAAVAAASPVAEATYRDYYIQSTRGRYARAGKPMPMPTYPEGVTRRGQHPLWVPEDGETLEELERRLRAWWHDRPGAGTGGGAPAKMTAGQVRLAQQRLAEPGATMAKVAREFGVAPSTVYRHLRLQRAAKGGGDG